mgnify:CR=1 FL=1
MIWQGKISYIAKIGDTERVEKDCYESESLEQVTEAIHKAVEVNKDVKVLEIHISKKE